MTATCLWCETGFEPRASGTQHRFCHSACRRAFDTACRKVGAAEIEAGRLQVSELRIALARGVGPEMATTMIANPVREKPIVGVARRAAPGAPWGEPFTYDGILKESPDEQHQD